MPFQLNITPCFGRQGLFHSTSHLSDCSLPPTSSTVTPALCGEVGPRWVIRATGDIIGTIIAIAGVCVALFWPRAAEKLTLEQAQA
jgi:hypothetical protein